MPRTPLDAYAFDARFGLTVSIYPRSAPDSRGFVVLKTLFLYKIGNVYL